MHLANTKATVRQLRGRADHDASGRGLWRNGLACLLAFGDPAPVGFVWRSS